MAFARPSRKPSILVGSVDLGFRVPSPSCRPARRRRRASTHGEGEPPAHPGRGDIRGVLCRSGGGTPRSAPGEATLSPARVPALTLVELQGSAQAHSLTRERSLPRRANMATDSSWHSPVPSSGWAALQRPLAKARGGAMLPSLPHWPECRRRKPVLLSPFQVPAFTFSSAVNWLLVHVNTRPVPALFSCRPIRTFLTARLNSDWFRKLAPIPFRPISYSSPKRTLPRHAQASGWSFSCLSYLSSSYPYRLWSPPGGLLVSLQVHPLLIPPITTS